MKGTTCALMVGLLAMAVPTLAADSMPRDLRLAADAPDADNTGRNVRDRDDAARTPMDQGGGASDRRITQKIRKAVVDNDHLSTNAKNTKIITMDGVVTLRGPVKSPQEKATIAALAQKTVGVKRVENQ